MQEEFAYIVSFTSPSNGTESFQFDLQTTVPIQVGETFWPRTGLCERVKPLDKSVFRVKEIQRTLRQVGNKMTVDQPCIILELSERR